MSQEAPPPEKNSHPGPGPSGPRPAGDSENEKTHIWDKPGNVDRLLRIFYGACIFLVLLEFVIHRHVAHPWERFFGFHAFYGFVACWTLVVVARVMRRFLMRDEDYYDVD